MQTFRKNGAFNTVFWVASGIFAALAGFDWYHSGKQVPVILIVACIACAVAALWGRGNLVEIDASGVQLNLGLFNKKKVALTDLTKIAIEPERRVKIFLRGAAVKSVTINLALLDPADRARFVEAAARLVPTETGK